ncbi:hypothetical protein [Streptomyces sp. NPDC127176]
MTRWNPAASFRFDGAAVGFFPDTGRDPAAATDFTSGPAAGRVEGAALGSGRVAVPEAAVATPAVASISMATPAANREM